MPVDFSDARLKLQRGREHIADLKTRIARFHSTNFYSLHLESEQGGHEKKVVFDSLQQPDKTINAVVGDAIGNIRSALDYIAVAIVAPITGSPEDITFPFANDDTGFAGETKARLLVPAAINFAINEIQAHKGGKGHTLWVLNKLRNIDKHRFLITANQMAGVTVSFSVSGGGIIENCFFGTKAGQKTTAIHLTGYGDIHLTSQPKASFTVVFEEPPWIQSTPVLDFLDAAASQVESILSPLEVLLA